MNRLQMVKSAGTLLGYFDAEECVFCGASAEHQRRAHAVYETVQLTEAIDAETSRTHALREDLSSTLVGIRSALMEAQDQVTVLNRQILSATELIAEIEERVGPTQEGLNELLTRRSQLERWITLWDQIVELQALSSSVAQERPETAEPVMDGIWKRSEIDFSAALRDVLTSWSVPGAKRAEFVLGTPPRCRPSGAPARRQGKGHPICSSRRV